MSSSAPGSALLSAIHLTGLLVCQVSLLEKGDLPIAGAENARALLTLTGAQAAQSR